MNEKILTVSQLNDYVTGIMMYDPILRNISLQGEVSGVSRSMNGHLYFSLKDEDALIRCVMFSADEDMVAMTIDSGEEIVVRGHVSLYSKMGEYQLYVKQIEKKDQGDAQKQLEQLKRKLAEQHYFDQENKRPIPTFPSKVGIVTSATGAVLHDILTVAQRRASMVSVIVAPSSVQGVNSVAELVAGIELLQHKKYHIDVIILARGGGSLEDLQAFNSEELADAIYDSTIPIVSAVGHETDFTIADLVADLRAPTPSVAAELVFPNAADLRIQLGQQYAQMQRVMDRKLELMHEIVNRKQHDFTLLSPAYQIKNHQQKNKALYEKISQIKQLYFQEKQFELKQRLMEIDLRNPQNILQRGYAMLQKENQVVTSIQDVQKKDIIEVALTDGSMQVKIMKIMEQNNKV